MKNTEKRYKQLSAEERAVIMLMRHEGRRPPGDRRVQCVPRARGDEQRINSNLPIEGIMGYLCDNSDIIRLFTSLFE